MKRISILASILCAVLCSMVWAQEPALATNSKQTIFQHRAMMRMSRMQAARISAQALPAHRSQIWQFGTYPGGTWAALQGINDFGIAVGFGDVPPLDKGPSGEGYTHTLAVPVFGPHAGEWIDLGTVGGEYSVGWEEPLNSISDTGVIVGHSATPSGYIHGAVWTQKSGMTDLGALADIGYPEYNGSFAWGTNRLGTLIVGWSGTDMVCFLGCSNALPVVWTPSGQWEKGKWGDQVEDPQTRYSRFSRPRVLVSHGGQRPWTDRRHGLYQRLGDRQTDTLEPAAGPQDLENCGTIFFS